MTGRKLLFRAISVLVFFAVFFIEKNMLGIPVGLLLVGLFSLITALFGNYIFAKSCDSKSDIKRTILVLLVFSILTYIFNYANVETVIQNYYYNTGEKPAFLYFKMCFNGIVVMLLAYFSFSFGYAVNGDLKLIDKIINVIINLTFFLALVNIVTWAISTGGVIGRYNFKPIFVASYGINAQWCILGFLLLLSKVDKFSFFSLKVFRLAVFVLSILIILSRLNQVFFLMSLLMYYYFISGSFSKIKLFFVSFISIGLILFLLPFFNENFLNSYSLLSSLDGEDFQIRMATIYASLNIFYDYLITGVGYGMYSGYNMSNIIVQRTEVNLGSAHNGLLSILSETGIMGLCIHATLIYYILNGVLKSFKNKKKYKFTISIQIFVILNIVMLVISNYFLFPPASEYSYIGISIVSWILIGILVSFNKVNN